MGNVIFQRATLKAWSSDNQRTLGSIDDTTSGVRQADASHAQGVVSVAKESQRYRAPAIAGLPVPAYFATSSATSIVEFFNPTSYVPTLRSLVTRATAFSSRTAMSF